MESPKSDTAVNPTDVDVMRQADAHQDPLDHPALLVRTVNPVVTVDLAKMESQANSFLRPPNHSQHAGHAPLDHGVPLAHLDHPDLRVPPDDPDKREETATPVDQAPMEPPAHLDLEVSLANLAHEDHPVSPDHGVSRATQDPRDHPATVDHLDPLVLPDPMATQEARDHPAPVARTASLETTVLPASRAPPVSQDHLAKMPNTVLALLVVLVARAKSSDHHCISHDIF